MSFNRSCFVLGALCILVLAFVASPVASLIVQPEGLPHWQAFDSWDNCYFDGVCYEQSCNHLRGGWYNPVFKDKIGGDPAGVEVRHWWIINQQTPTNWEAISGDPVTFDQMTTGPYSDHTHYPIPKKGKFMYAESSFCYNVTFWVITPTIIFDNTGAQLTFYSYRYGASLDAAGGTPAQLMVDASTDNGTNWENIYSVSGAHEAGSNDTWEFHELDLDGLVTGLPASQANPVEVVFRFNVLSGDDGANTGYHGDLAIDDVIWTQDGAGPVGPPYIDPNHTRTEIPTPPPSKKGHSSGDGLSTGAIIGIVVGIVGGACILCCLLCLCLLGVLLWVSPRHAPEVQADSGM